MLPVFPNFKKIELSDKKTIDNYTKEFPPYNDFEFVSLWTYNTKNENTISFLHDNLVIRIQDFVTGKFFYSFIGTSNLKETITALLAKSKEENIEAKLFLIPEVNFQKTPIKTLQTFFSVREDEDSFDYVLDIDKIIALKGSEYHDKRNLVNRFVKSYPQHKVESLDLTTEKVKQEIKDLFFLWETNKEKSRNDTQIELIAIEKVFDLVNILNLAGTGIYADNKLIGFSFYNVVQNNFSILSFEKADTSYKGIYEFLMHQTAKQVKTLGCKYINYEQDLGKPGLKKAKMLWRPVFFLKKYVIEELK